MTKGPSTTRGRGPFRPTSAATPPSGACCFDEPAKGRNRFRSVEYSLSSTLMIILVCLVLGISDIAALIGLGIANISMILFGWLMEMTNNVLIS